MYLLQGKIKRSVLCPGGGGGRRGGRVFKKKHFGVAVTSLDSEVWTLPEESGLHAATFLESSFKKHQELFPGLLRICAQPCSTRELSTREQGGGWHTEAGRGAPGRFSKIIEDRVAGWGTLTAVLLATRCPVMVVDSFSPPFPGELALRSHF